MIEGFLRPALTSLDVKVRDLVLGGLGRGDDAAALHVVLLDLREHVAHLGRGRAAQHASQHHGGGRRNSARVGFPDLAEIYFFEFSCFFRFF